jgi:hypothetical protein
MMHWVPITKSRTPLWFACAGLALWALTGAAGAGDGGVDYVRTITDREVLDLIAGERLEKSDTAYCEKARDICLAGLCGSLDRSSTNRECWEQCTEAVYQRCTRAN